MSAQVDGLIRSGPPTRVFPNFQLTGLIYYLIINRTTGVYRESMPVFGNGEIGLNQLTLFQNVRKRAILSGMAAIQKGYLSLLRNEMTFQYTYDLKFTNSKGAIVSPPGRFEKPRFAEGGIFYPAITNQLFDDDPDISCYEMTTVYLGIMNIEFISDANHQLFDLILKNW
jgi:hypothetical protein